MMHAHIATAATIALVIAALGFAGESDYTEALVQEAEYCQSVAYWLDDKADGIPPMERIGHPDYKSIYWEVCQ